MACSSHSLGEVCRASITKLGYWGHIFNFQLSSALAILLLSLGFALEIDSELGRRLLARPLRIDYPGAFHHITTRGVARRDIFFDDEDRDVFLHQLAQAHERWGIVIHAYCLMTNHDHLDLQTPEGHLSRSLQWSNQNYASHVNRRYQRSGHLFQGRFKNVLVEAEAHLHELTRYLHLNPVRAGIVSAPRPISLVELSRRSWAAAALQLAAPATDPKSFWAWGHSTAAARPGIRRTGQRAKPSTSDGVWRRTRER